MSALAGGGIGALRGGAESDAETSDGRLDDAMRGAGEEAAMYAAAGGAGELGAAALGRATSRLPIMRENLTRGELHARGLWASRADEAARRFPGGREGLVRELNRLDAPLRAEEIPRWAAEQAEIVGPRVRQAAQDLTDAGARIDMGANAAAAESLAAGAQNRAGGPAVARSLRSSVVEPWQAQAAQAPEGIPFNDAWDERQWLDDLMGDLPQQGLGRAKGRMLEARRMLSGSMSDEAARVSPELAEQWTQANRDFAPLGLLGAFGQGAERLNTLGGGAGMISRASGTAHALYGNPLGVVEAVAGPAVQQELRMRLPGMQVRALRALIPVLEQGGPALQRAAAVLRGAQARGPAAVRAAHYMMAQSSPEYRQAQEQAAQAAEEIDR